MSRSTGHVLNICRVLEREVLPIDALDRSVDFVYSLQLKFYERLHEHAKSQMPPVLQKAQIDMVTRMFFRMCGKKGLANLRKTLKSDSGQLGREVDSLVPLFSGPEKITNASLRGLASSTAMVLLCQTSFSPAARGIQHLSMIEQFETLRRGWESGDSQIRSALKPYQQLRDNSVVVVWRYIAATAGLEAGGWRIKDARQEAQAIANLVGRLGCFPIFTLSAAQYSRYVHLL
jgi:hypothetical protein